MGNNKTEAGAKSESDSTRFYFLFLPYPKFSVMKLFYLLSFLLLSFPLFAEKSYFLKGTLGKSEIYMSFTDYTMDYSNENEISDVLYFYKKSLKDIVLRGTKNDNTFTFYFDQEDEKFKEKFSLTMDENKNFTGTWEAQDGKKLNVTLLPISTDQLNNPFTHQDFIKKMKETDPYNYAKSSFLTFQNDSISTFNTKHFQWISETHASTYGFLLGDNFDSIIRKKQNEFLEKTILENALDQLSCASEWEYSSGNGIEYTIKLTYLDENLLGFKIFSSFYCGGAHPDFGSEGFLLNLSSGKRYDIDEIVAFDSSVVMYSEEPDNFTEFAEYKEKYFAPHLVQMMKEIQHFESPGNEEECDYTDPENWNFVSWSYEENGIAFIPIFARVLRSCEEEFIIPFEKLKDWKNPAFPYAFPSQ